MLYTSAIAVALLFIASFIGSRAFARKRSPAFARTRRIVRPRD